MWLFVFDVRIKVDEWFVFMDIVFIVINDNDDDDDCFFLKKLMMMIVIILRVYKFVFG